MKPALLIVLLGLATANAQTAEEEVRKVVRSASEALSSYNAQSLGALFTDDGDLWVGEQRHTGSPERLSQAVGPPRPMSEMSPPRLENERVRFVSPDVVIVDAQRVQHGSLVVRSAVPAMLILIRRAGQWRIATMRFGLSICGLPGV